MVSNPRHCANIKVSVKTHEIQNKSHHTSSKNLINKFESQFFLLSQMNLTGDGQFFSLTETCEHLSFAVILYHQANRFYFHAACYSTSLAAQQRSFTSPSSATLSLKASLLALLLKIPLSLRICPQVLYRESQRTYSTIRLMPCQSRNAHCYCTQTPP